MDKYIAVLKSAGEIRQLSLNEDHFDTEKPEMLCFFRMGGCWHVQCGDGQYLSGIAGDIRKNRSMKLTEGRELALRNGVTGALLMTISMFRDYRREQRTYRCRISLDRVRAFRISGRSMQEREKACEDPETAEPGGLYAKSGRSGQYAEAERGERLPELLLQDPSAAKEELLLMREDSARWRLTVLRTAGYTFLENRQVRTDLAAGEAAVADGSYLDVGEYSFYFRAGALFAEEMPEIRFTGGLDPEILPACMNREIYGGSTGGKKYNGPKEIRLEGPPPFMEKPRRNLLTALLPSAGMAAAAGFMAAFGGSRMILFSGISAGTAIVTAVSGIAGSSRDYRKYLRTRESEYRGYLAGAERRILREREKEEKALCRCYPAPEVLLEQLADFSPLLFGSRTGSDDFMRVRIGTGTVKASCHVVCPEKRASVRPDPLASLPGALKERFRYLADVPEALDLSEACAVSVEGSRPFRENLLRIIILDLVLRHGPAELLLAVAADNRNRTSVRWLRKLPHIRGEDGASRYLMTDPLSEKWCMDELWRELKHREAAAASGKRTDGWRRIVAVFYDIRGFCSHPLAAYAGRSGPLGVSFIFAAEQEDAAPGGCTHRIRELQDRGERTAKWFPAGEPEEAVHVTVPAVSEKQAEEAAGLLGPVSFGTYAEDRSLPEQYLLSGMLGLTAASEADPLPFWAENTAGEALPVPLGMSEKGLLCLDIHESGDGPHGLVAGTTGSGKSELLQTFIVSAAFRYPPERIAFLLIDFKGGTMAFPFRDLPHLAGAITNLDGKEIDRSLKSIRAELRKRQKLLSAAGVNHIDRYQQKREQGIAPAPLPHLIVIVDEFAELKVEHPEFMKELISASRIGRSLGVHLILATQKPAGVVDEQIWSNSRFRICLKVQSKADSNEVLRSPEAADIRSPVRAWLQVGDGEIFMPFQSAYGGAPDNAGADDQAADGEIAEILFDGRRRILQSASAVREDIPETLTQQEAVIGKIVQAARDCGIAPAEKVFLPPLPDLVFYDPGESPAGCGIPLGLADDPEEQSQEEICWDPAHGHLLIIGAGGTGKTNLLQLMIRGIAERSPPEKAHIYIIDFNTMALCRMKALKHVGDTVTPPEEDKLRNLRKLLLEETERRRRVFSEAGVTSFAAYEKGGFPGMPRLFLVIDNLAALLESCAQESDALLYLLREGASCGITVIASGSRTAGIGYRYLTSFPQKIAFHTDDPGDYTLLFERSGCRPGSIPGRCVLRNGQRLNECQIYMAFSGDTEGSRARSMQEAAEKINLSYAMSPEPPGIPCIPPVLKAEDMERMFPGILSENDFPAGMSYSDCSPVLLKLRGLSVLGLSGSPGRGHTNFISYLLSFLDSASERFRSEVFLIDNISRKYSAFSGHPAVKGYGTGAAKLLSVLSEWESGREDSTLRILAADGKTIAAACSSESARAGELLKEIFFDAENGGNLLLITDTENAMPGADTHPALRTIIGEAVFLHMGPLDDFRIFHLPYDLLREMRGRMTAGDAFLIAQGRAQKIRLVKAGE